MYFNSIQNQRLEIMKSIALELAKEDVVLKGGTGLLLCYGLDRFSEDMDFDGNKRFNLERTQKLIEKAFAKQNVKVTQIIIKKNTPTTKRLMVHYEVKDTPNYAYPLKIEFSFRQATETAKEDSTFINGIRVYTIEKLAEKKFNAFLDRTAPRDIYDVAFLMGNYPHVFSKDMLNSINEMNPDELASTFDGSKADDLLLSDFTGTELIYSLFETTHELLASDNKKSEMEM